MVVHDGRRVPPSPPPWPCCRRADDDDPLRTAVFQAAPRAYYVYGRTCSRRASRLACCDAATRANSKQQQYRYSSTGHVYSFRLTIF
eukprot:SAG31_NODE_19859_length_590_cov_0.629328_1_plen_87_part_00